MSGSDIATPRTPTPKRNHSEAAEEEEEEEDDIIAAASATASAPQRVSRASLISESLASQGRQTNASHVQKETHKALEPRFETATPTSAAIFRSNTIAPSPPPNSGSEDINPFARSNLDTNNDDHNNQLQSSDIQNSKAASPSPSSNLRIQTDLYPTSTTNAKKGTRETPADAGQHLYLSSASSKLPVVARTPSLKKMLAKSLEFSSSGINSAPGSALSSPMLKALADVTPLPSPILSADSPGPWRKLQNRSSRDSMIQSQAQAQAQAGPDSVLVTVTGETITAAMASQSKRRTYQNLASSGAGETALSREKHAEEERHRRNRSISEYVPEAMQVPKPRQVAVSGSHLPFSKPTPEEDVETSTLDGQMRREPNLATQRGLSAAVMPRPPTPPSSRAGGESSDSDSSLSNIPRNTPLSSSSLSSISASASAYRRRRRPPPPRYEYFEARSRRDSKRRRWRALGPLGEGTFSKVILATSQAPVEDEDCIDEEAEFGAQQQQQQQQQMDGEAKTKISTEHYDRSLDRKKLVAIKICEHGPKGGASEDRVEMSLKRELEIMKSISHPSLVHLKAWSVESTRAVLVLGYCAGGDLFEVASQYRDVLSASVVRRIFAELVGAVQYLHERHIVHRDIKLENVLVNLPRDELVKPTDWTTYPYSLVTLTDLGLSRRVADDEKLTTRCGSDDYAAPEVIMGQPYDGRAVDAWSLGVLLYALLESRLPFDPSPAMSEAQRMRPRTSHRIARVEWTWVEYAAAGGADGDGDGDDDGDAGGSGEHEGSAARFARAGLLGAMHITEGLLKRARSRWTVAGVAAHEWVAGGIRLGDGAAISFREEDDPVEVLHDIDSNI